jgi:hypothetical protein
MGDNPVSDQSGWGGLFRASSEASLQSESENEAELVSLTQ